MDIHNDITETIGRTPLVKLGRLGKGIGANLIVKIESFNPLHSVKDRIGVAMIDDAEKRSLIKPGDTLVEPTSGNTGIALAFAAARRGYKLILTLPEGLSGQRRAMLEALGAKVEMTPHEFAMQGAVDRANEIVEKTPGTYMLQQFNNPANPDIHRRTTGPEIWDDTGGKIDAFVAGVGTGGTITGVGRFLKEKNPAIKIIAVEPLNNAVLSGKKPGFHRIQGIGAGFIPQVLDMDVIDEIIPVADDDAASYTRRLAREEGIFAGISSGAAMWAACRIGRRKTFAKKNIVTLLPDLGERYLTSWVFN